VVYARDAEDAPAVLHAVRAKLKELAETPGLLLPEVRLEIVHDQEMPAEEWFRLQGDFPANISSERMTEAASQVRLAIESQPEVMALVTRHGFSDGPSRADASRLHCFIRIDSRAQRSRAGIIQALRTQLNVKVPGVEWSVAAWDDDDFAEIRVGGAQEHIVKLSGAGLDKLSELAERVRTALAQIEGIEDLRSSGGKFAPTLELNIDRIKCKRLGLQISDVQVTIQAATSGLHATDGIEGEKNFAVVVRWPKQYRNSESALLDLPLDPPGVEAIGGVNPVSQPRFRLRDVLLQDGDGNLKPPGAAVIFRENGQRVVAVKFRVRPGAESRALAEARQQVAVFVPPPGYTVEWIDGR
jgi:cobalt-zinc-cadmium resistance protein CzcA